MSNDFIYGYHKKMPDLLKAFGLDGKGVTEIRLEGSTHDLLTIRAKFYLDNPEREFTDYFTFGLKHIQWETCCIGCKYYGFGGYCGLITGYIPVPEDAWSFYCKLWKPADRNMILYRRFIQE